MESLRSSLSSDLIDVVVVDNGSTDGTLPWLRELGWVRLIENGKNLGFGNAVNIGIEMADPESDIITLNNDIRIIDVDWIARLQECAYSDPHIGLVGCRLVGSGNTLHHYGSYVGPTSGTPHKYGGEQDFGQYVTRREVHSVVAAVMYIKRAVISKIGGFHKEYFAYYEDTDYCLSAREAGFTVWYAGDVCLYHDESTTTKANNISLTDLQSASRPIFDSRWRSKVTTPTGPSLLWRSAIFGPGGYANASRHFLSGLHDDGVRVAFESRYPQGEPSTGVLILEELRQRSAQEPCATVVFDVADLFAASKSSGKRIGYTMLEVDGIHADWVHSMNAMDAIWAPSNFNARTFAECGVRVPIHVVPLGVNTDRYHPNVRQLREPDTGFVFLSVFAWGDRKNPKALLRAFNRAFRSTEDVILVIHAVGGDWHMLKSDIASLDLSPKGGRIQVFMNVDMPDYQMPALYRSADAFVTATHGEGWGLPILEAMAVGLPVIATNWSAHTDFFDASVGYPVDVAEMTPAVAPCPYYAGHRWASVSEDHLQHLLRYVYTHREESRSVGQRAAVRARAYSWQNSVHTARAFLGI